MNLLNRNRIRAYLDTVERHRVVVHTKAGSSIEGILTALYPDDLVLEHASVLSSGGRLAIDGEAVIGRSEVDWIQRLGPGEEA